MSWPMVMFGDLRGGRSVDCRIRFLIFWPAEAKFSGLPAGNIACWYSGGKSSGANGALDGEQVHSLVSSALRRAWPTSNGLQ